MTALRARAPKQIGTHAVEAISDFSTQTRTASDGTLTMLGLPTSNVLTFDLEGEPGDRSPERYRAKGEVLFLRARGGPRRRAGGDC